MNMQQSSSNFGGKCLRKLGGKIKENKKTLAEIVLSLGFKYDWSLPFSYKPFVKSCKEHEWKTYDHSVYISAVESFLDLNIENSELITCVAAWS